MQYFENELARILINNGDIFTREKYRAVLAESQVILAFTHLSLNFCSVEIYLLESKINFFRKISIIVFAYFCHEFVRYFSESDEFCAECFDRKLSMWRLL